MSSGLKLRGLPLLIGVVLVGFSGVAVLGFRV